ncbi:hypothetical protein JCM6882_007042 [Rhodosporidiobolus microsporus]
MLENTFFSSTTTLIAAQWTDTAWVEPFISNLLVSAFIILAAFVAFTICEDFLYEYEVSEWHTERCILVQRAVVLFSFGGYLAWSGRAAEFWSGFIGRAIANFGEWIFEQVKPLLLAFFFCVVLLVRLLTGVASGILYTFFFHILLSLSLYSARAWLVISFELCQIFSQSFRYSRNPRRFRRKLQQARLLQITEEYEAVSLFISALGDLPPSSGTPLPPHPAEILESTWVNWLPQCDNSDIYEFAFFLHAHVQKHTLPAAFGSFAFADQLLLLDLVGKLLPRVTDEYKWHYSPPQTLISQTQAVARVFVGPLVTHLLPFPLLSRLARPFTRQHLLAIVFGPFIHFVEYVQVRDPAKWVYEAKRFGLDALSLPDAASLRLLQGVAEFLEEAVQTNSTDEEIKEQFEALLKRVQAEHRAVEVEKRAHEAILDAVLMWKEEKTERAGRK